MACQDSLDQVEMEKGEVPSSIKCQDSLKVVEIDEGEDLSSTECENYVKVVRSDGEEGHFPTRRQNYVKMRMIDAGEGPSSVDCKVNVKVMKIKEVHEISDENPQDVSKWIMFEDEAVQLDRIVSSRTSKERRLSVDCKANVNALKIKEVDESSGESPQDVTKWVRYEDETMEWGRIESSSTGKGFKLHFDTPPVGVTIEYKKLKFVKSQRGRDQLLHEGYLHKLEKSIGEKKIWKCADFHKHRCPGRAHTVADEVVSYTEHTHVADIAAVRAKEIVNKIKEQSLDSSSTAVNILSEQCSNVPDSVAGLIPSMPLLKRRISQYKRKSFPNLPLPQNVHDLIFPEGMLTTQNDETFLFFDSGPSVAKRIVIFGTAKMAALLKEHLNWFFDGTFKAAPNGFSQLFTIHALYEGHVVPILYSLLPDKSMTTYLQVFQIILDRFPNISPKSVLLDFETDLILSVQKVFPQAQIHGCFFHFTQALWRNIEYFGLQENYVADPDFAHNIRMLTALAFVPTEEVVTSFEKLMDTPFFQENDQMLSPFLDNFEDTWIGRYSRKGQRVVGCFPVSFWNCFNNIIDGLASTNNSVEGWHNRFSSLVSVHHANMWRFVEKLKLEQQYHEVNFQKIISGAEIPNTKDKNQVVNEKLKNLAKSYSTVPITTYLSSVALNFNLQK